MISLYVIQGPGRGHRFELCETTTTIGSDPSCQVCLRDLGVSRRHAHIEFSDGRFQLYDDENVSGIFVNGKKVKEHVLKNNDQILLGQTLLLFAARFPKKIMDEEHFTAPFFAEYSGAEHDERHIAQSIPFYVGDDLLLTPFPPFSRDRESELESHLKMLYRTTLITSQTLDIGVLLHRILDLIFEWIEIDRGSIMLFDQESFQLIPQATRLSRNPSETDEANPTKLTINKSIIGYVLKRREGVLTNDAQNDARWNVHEQDVSELICVPMIGRYGLVGIVYVDLFQKEKQGQNTSSPPSVPLPRLSSDHLRLMVAIAHQAALAVEDTRYYKGMLQGERLAVVGQTVMTLSHHIKNILQGISGGSHLIQLGLDKHNEDLIGKGWDIVERNQTRISHLILDMLTFSKEREPAYALRDMNETVLDVVNLLQTRAKEQNIDIVLKQEKTIPKFYFDAEQIHRAITNIVTNGIEAVNSFYDDLSEGSQESTDLPKQYGLIQISVDWDEENSLVRINMEDNGPGIPKSQWTSLFKPFYSNKKGHGTGLGLSVARKIVQEHEGTLQIEDSPLGGACFKITLPLKLYLNT